MLFSYHYVEHSVETFQLWLDHLVKEVWCKAAADFSLDLLHPDLRAVVEEIYNTEEGTTSGKIHDWLYGPITKIYGLFKTQLTAAQRLRVSEWYDHNNDIEALCACDPAKLPATYADIAAINADLEPELKAFCKSLFTDVIHLKPVTSRIGEINAHYTAFVAENKAGKCPYCGYGDIKGTHHTRREAYDHYLPKGTYPFNSVNFRNLAPMCHECNSSYKLQLDPTRHIDPISRKNTGNRRKAFYSFAAASPSINIGLTLNTLDVTNLARAEIDLRLTAPGHDEEVEAWCEVFGIDERFKAKCCGENDGKYWLVQALDECKNEGKTSQDIIEKIHRNATAKPWAEINFLKKPFLEACEDAGLLRSIG